MRDGLELLKPFLPGLEDVLEDPEVSEIMINGPHNVWIEGHGKLYSHEAPLLTAAALQRAAIHIARPLGLDPSTAPIVDARLEDGSRVASVCHPPARRLRSPCGALANGHSRRRTCCKPSTPDTAALSPPCTPTTPNRPCHGSPVAPCREAGSFPGR